MNGLTARIWKDSSSSSIGTTTLSWVRPAQLSLSILSRKVLQSVVASGTSNPQLGGIWKDYFKIFENVCLRNSSLSLSNTECDWDRLRKPSLKIHRTVAYTGSGNRLATFRVELLCERCVKSAARYGVINISCEISGLRCSAIKVLALLGRYAV
jgi:hypothetical protein